MVFHLNTIKTRARIVAVRPKTNWKRSPSCMFGFDAGSKSLVVYMLIEVGS
jgi:hypothetical protein